MENYARSIYAIWTVLLCVSWGWSYYQGQRAAISAAHTQAHAAFDRDLVYRNWAEHWGGGVYVPVTGPTSGSSGPKAAPLEVVSADGKRLGLVNHADMTRKVYDLAQTEYGIRGHMTLRNPLNNEKPPDAWERRALEAVGGDSNDYSSVDVVGGTAYMRLMHPLVNEAHCMRCHGDDGYTPGETIGGISIGVPMAPFWGAERERMAHLAGGHAILWSVGMLSIGLGSRRMRQQVSERERAEMLLRESETEARELHRQVKQASDLLEAAFGRYVDPRVVTEIIESTEPMRLGGERKLVTVLMSDIRGFTNLSEQMDAHSMVEFLNCYFSAMAEIIFEHHGMLDKFVGDGIVALFGTPVAHEDDPLRAVKTALAMHRKLAELNAAWSANGGPNIQIGVGISTGELVVGNIGSPRRHDYTAIGKDVNIASRLEALTKELSCNILVSDATYALLKNQVDAVDLGLKTIRGLEAPVRVYGILGLAPPDESVQ